MPTTFATTAMFVMVQLNSLGLLVPVEKPDLPAGYTNATTATLEACNFMRGRLEHPEKTTCQQFTSAKTTSWTDGGVAAPITPAEASGGVDQPIAQESLQPDPPGATDYVLLYYEPGVYRWISEGGGLSLRECSELIKQRERKYTGVHCLPTPSGHTPEHRSDAPPEPPKTVAPAAKRLAQQW